MVAFSCGSDDSGRDASAPHSDGSGTNDRVTERDDHEAETGDRVSDDGVSVRTSDGTVVVSVGDAERALTRAEAADLRRAVGDAIAGRRELYRTVGEFRPDGSYVVARRGADSDGNAKVFAGFAAVGRLYDRLPAEFGAGEVGAHSEVTGSRRHMLVRHFAEHPAFDCEVVCRNPLRAAKSGDDVSAADGTTVEDATDGSEGTAADERPVDAAPAEVGGG